MTLERVQQSITRYRDAAVAAGAQLALRQPNPGSALAFGEGTALPLSRAREFLESMLLARHIDRLAFELRAEGPGLYTITSAGHESNVVLGHLLRPTDPSLVHYRSAALLIERARHLPDLDPVKDLVLSLVGSREDPISGGRHKVFGSHPLGVIPQTSTIASHLPRALGLAFALARRRGLGNTANYPEDAVVMASFGDASINHSTWLGATNAAGWLAAKGEPLPLLLVCEDNGLGISVRSPQGWVEARLRHLPGVRYFDADGRDLAQTFQRASEAVAFCRLERSAAVLHLRCSRLLGHVGTDLDSAYRSRAEIKEAEAADPLLCLAVALVEGRAMSPQAVLALDDQAADRVNAAREQGQTTRGLSSREEIQAPLIPKAPVPPSRLGETPALAVPGGPFTLARGIQAALDQALELIPEVQIFGEDVGVKGGIHGITQGLLARHGATRVFDTLLDEQSILGLALGLGQLGLLPVPEIQYLAFYHHAQDQIRGEAATLPFFSRSLYRNPMLVRIAGLADPRGVGGHFHNDNTLAGLRDVPGLVIAIPARAEDALELYRTAFALAQREHRVVVMIEPLALYHERDLYAPGDRAWLSRDSGQTAEVGRARVYHPEHSGLTLASFGRGVRICLRVARILLEEYGILARVLDVRWVAPLPIEDLVHHGKETQGLLWVDETRETGSVSETLAALLMDRHCDLPFARVTAADCWVPIGPAAQAVLPTEEQVVNRALELARHRGQPASPKLH